MTESKTRTDSYLPQGWALPKVASAAMVFALIVSAATYVAAGPTLGLFLGSVAMASILVPPLCQIRANLLQALMITAAICDGVALVWVTTLFNSPVTIVQLLLSYAVLAGWCVALVGLTRAIARIAAGPHLAPRQQPPGARELDGISNDASAEVIASAIVVVLALLWLACPIWIPAATGARIDALLAVHPLFALNGVLPDLGFWTQQALAYRYLFTLGQDVPYTLPPTVWPCVAVHSLIGLIGLGISRVRGKT